jgi:hypothetical protein
MWPEDKLPKITRPAADGDLGEIDPVRGTCGTWGAHTFQVCAPFFLQQNRLVIPEGVLGAHAFLFLSKKEEEVGR